MNNNIQNYNVNKTFGANKMENKEPKNFQEQLDMAVAKLIERSEREVPEYGDFAVVSEMFDNRDPKTANIAGKFAVAVKKMPKDVEPDPKQRFIEAAAYEPTGNYKSSRFVGEGYKDHILELLKDPKFVEELAYIYGDLLDALKDT